MNGDGLNKVLSEFEGYLAHLKETGVTHVAASAAAVAGLAQAPRREPKKRKQVPAAESGLAEKGLAEIAETIRKCVKCGLHAGRTKTVPGQGCPRPEILFIGEGPGQDEDLSGLAFVGAAGQLLTKMIAAMGLSREEVFIANIVKCRPPGNRVPQPDEVAACIPYLKEQIRLIRPKVIVALGAVCVKSLLDPRAMITKMRGKWMTYEDIDVMPTFHPSYLLRCPSEKRLAWEDLKTVLKKLGRTPPVPTGDSPR